MAIANKPIDSGATAGGFQVLPERAQVIVIGAGVIGCSVAYHLTRLGCRDVLILERKQIACGTSWHSLGVVGLLRTNPVMSRLAMETANLIPVLERETGISTDYMERGSINVTEVPARMTQFRRIADMGRSAGLEVNELGIGEIKQEWPLINADGLIGGIHIPKEGQCNPVNLTRAYLAGAQKGGASICEGVNALDFELVDGQVKAVVTASGRIECEFAVNCTGIWAREFGRRQGMQSPLQGVEHSYLVTEFSDKITEGLPIMRDMDSTVCIREDGGRFSVGFNETTTKLFASDGVPEDFCFDELPPSWENASPYIEQAVRRVPVLNEIGIRLFLCGPESVTPDTRYMLGPVPGFENYFVAAGFSGIGVGSSGGAGRALAQWIIEGRPEEDVWCVDRRRMQSFQSNRQYLEGRATEAQGKLYALNWPHQQFETMRGLRRSPLHQALKLENACFGCAAGWEVPQWFGPPGVEPCQQYSFEKPDWFPYAQQELKAAISQAVISDRSHIAKFVVCGLDVRSALSALCANNPDIPIGTKQLTPILNERGGVEGIWTMIRRARNEFLILSEAETQVRDLDLLHRHLSKWPSVSVIDVTSGYAVVEVTGPGARGVIAQTGRAGADQRNWYCEIEPAFETAGVIAILVREDRLVVPSWMLIVASEFACAVYEQLRESALSSGLRMMGQHARDALWTLSGCPIWSKGVTSVNTANESGLSYLVDLSEERQFIGRKAFERHRGSGSRYQLVSLEIQEPDAVLFGNEPIYCNGQWVGVIVQAAYALATEGAIGLGYVDASPAMMTGNVTENEYSVMIAGRSVSACSRPKIRL